MTDTKKIDLFTIGREQLIDIVSDGGFIKPINYYFLLALPTIEEKTASGIILPGSTHDLALTGNNIGRVVGMGKTIGGVTGEYEECKEIKIGDYVGYNPNAGLPHSHDNYNLLCIADQAIRSRIYDMTKHTDGIFNTYGVRGVNK